MNVPDDHPEPQQTGASVNVIDRLKQKEAAVDLLEGSIWKTIIVFALPIMLGSFFQQLYNMVDAIIIGRAVGTDALAAVGATATTTSLMLGAFTAISGGASVVISQYYGAKDQERVEKAVHTAMAFSLSGGMTLVALGFVLARPFMRLTKVPEEIIDQSVLYMRVYFAGMVGNLLYNMETGILRAIGDSRTPLIVLVFTSMLNILFDLTFVLWFRWGVFGVAFGTILSQMISALAVLIVLMRAKGSYRVSLKKIRFHWSIFKEVVRIGVPSGMETICYNVTNMVAQTVINGFGTAAIAAWSAVLRVDCILYIVQQACALSTATMVGQNFGAAKYERVKKVVRTGLSMNMAAIGTAAILICLFCPQVLGWFTDDPEVIAIGCILLYSLAPSNCLNVFINILPGSIRACGESLQPMLITLICICGLRLGVLLGLVPRFHSMVTVSLAWPISWSITATIFIVYYLRGKWLSRCIRRQNSNAV